MNVADLVKQVIKKEPGDELSQLNLSVSYFQTGNYKDALIINQKLVRLNPKNAGYWNNLGNTLVHLEKFDEALNCFSMSIELNPQEPQFLVNRSNAWILLREFDRALVDLNASITMDKSLAIAYANRANLFSERGAYREALEDIRIAIDLDKTNAEFYFNCGNIHTVLGNFDQSIKAFHTACVLDNKFIQAFINLSNLLFITGIYTDAIRVLREGYEINPNSVQLAIELGDCLLKLGHTQKAHQIYSSALLTDPTNEELLYSLSSIDGTSPPAKAPLNYVKRLFNNYASTYNDHLQNILQYKVPNYLKEQIFKFNPQTPNRALDLGCGTGLVGKALLGFYKKIDGVDISVQMLKKCTETRIYNQLYLDDIEYFIKTSNSTYDLIIASDVFIYLGSLDEIFNSISKKLNPFGLFAFSIESSNNADFVLQPTKRYSHSLGYIEKISCTLGFKIIEISHELIRKELPKEVLGFTVLLQKPPN